MELRGSKTVGEPLTVRRGGIELHAQIVWWEGSIAGLWFPKPMNEGTFVLFRQRTVS
jgi:hypothetical protein